MVSKRLTRIALIGLALFALTVWFLLGGGGNSKPPTIGAKTTCVLGPLTEDGFVDYFAAVNQINSEDVPAKENAAIDLIRAIDRSQLGDQEWKILSKQYPSIHDVYVSPPSPPFFESASAAIMSESGELRVRPWDKKQKPDFAQWLERNQTPLKLLERAATKSKYWMPLVPRVDEEGVTDKGLYFSDSTDLQQIRDVVGCLLVRAMQHLGNGDVESCQDDIISARRIGCLVTQNVGGARCLIGLGIQQMAAASEQTMIKHAELSDEQLIRYSSMLNQLPEHQTFFNSIDKVERLMVLSTVQQMYLGKLNFRQIGFQNGAADVGSFDLDLLMRRVNDAFDHFGNLILDSDNEFSSQWMAEILSGKNRSRVSASGLIAGKRGRTNALANQIFEGLMPGLMQIGDAFINFEVELDLAHVAIALIRFKLSEGSFPDSLSQVVPAYLAKTPVDKYSRSPQPLGYAKTPAGCVLYSVGRNRKDNTSAVEVIVQGGDDIRIVFGKPESSEKPGE